MIETIVEEFEKKDTNGEKFLSAIKKYAVHKFTRTENNFKIKSILDGKIKICLYYKNEKENWDSKITFSYLNLKNKSYLNKIEKIKKILKNCKYEKLQDIETLESPFISNLSTTPLTSKSPSSK